MSLLTQDLGSESNYDDIKMYPASKSTGYYTKSAGYGMDLKQIPGTKFYYKFVDNGIWSYTVDSFIFLGYMNGEDGYSETDLDDVTYLIKIN